MGSAGGAGQLRARAGCRLATTSAISRPDGCRRLAADAASVEPRRQQRQRGPKRAECGPERVDDRGELHAAAGRRPDVVSARRLYEPVHPVGNQRDPSDHATEPRAVAGSAAERGELGERLWRLAPGNSTGSDPGAGRNGHGPDGGAAQPGELRPGDDGGAAGELGQPGCGAHRQRSADRCRRVRRWARSAASRCRTTSPITAC